MNPWTLQVTTVFSNVIIGGKDQINQLIHNYESNLEVPLWSQTDDNGRNLLHYACMYNTDEVATWMLSSEDVFYGQPIPKIRDKFGVTAVMYAARAGMVAFVKEWINQGADIMSADKHGVNILDYCLGAGVTFPEQICAAWDPNKGKIDEMKQVAQMLTDNGVKSSALEKRNMTPLDYIDKYCYFIDSDVNVPAKIQKAIYKCVTKEMSQCHTCLAVCFMQNDNLDNNARVTKFAEKVSNARLNINETDENGMTALHYLCYYEYDSEPYEYDIEPYGLRELLVSKLLELGADPNIKDIRGYTPLMCALQKGYVDLYDQDDPRRANVQGLGRLLNAYDDVTQSTVDTNQKISKGNEHLNEFKQRQEELNNNLMDELTEFKKINSELQDKLEEKSKNLQEFENRQNDLVQIVKEQQQEIISLKSKLQDLDRKLEINQINHDPTSSLLIGNVTMPDVCRHLETDVEVICLPDASLEDLQATISKDNQKYKNMYLVTGSKGADNDEERKQKYQELLEAAKNKCAKVIVSSALPALEDDDVNEKIQQINKILEGLCQEAGCMFVDNDLTFKYQGGSTIEACFDEEGEELSEFGVKNLLRNIGLLTSKKKTKAAKMTSI